MTCPISSTADFFGQDYQYAALGYCIPQNFTIYSPVSYEKIVIDNNTGLEWQQTLSGLTYSRAAAENYCSDLTYGGYDDWRLPTPKELTSIVNLDKSYPAIDSTYFPNTPSGKFANRAYSSTITGEIKRCKGGYTGASTVGSCVGTCTACSASQPTFCQSYVPRSYTLSYTMFGTGTNDTVTCGSSSWSSCTECPTDFYVRCVRGNSLEDDVFSSSTINGDVVITDSTTGLIWQKTYTTKTWQAALKYCEDLTYAGYADWRAPNKNELVSLYNIVISATSDFPEMPLDVSFWSSSTSSFDSKQAWVVKGAVVNFTVTANKTSTNSVRCVRN